MLAVFYGTFVCHRPPIFYSKFKEDKPTQRKFAHAHYYTVFYWLKEQFVLINIMSTGSRILHLENKDMGGKINFQDNLFTSDLDQITVYTSGLGTRSLQKPGDKQFVYQAWACIMPLYYKFLTYFYNSVTLDIRHFPCDMFMSCI